MHMPQGALLAEGVPEQLLQLLLQAEPGPNQQRLLEALHCLSARPASDTLPAPLCSPACVARLLLLASDAELMSGVDRVRPLASPLHSRSRTLPPLYFRLYRWLRYTRALLLTHGCLPGAAPHRDSADQARARDSDRPAARARAGRAAHPNPNPDPNPNPNPNPDPNPNP